MMPLIFQLPEASGTPPGGEGLLSSLCAGLSGERGVLSLRHFPDGETYLRVESTVDGRDVVILASLHEPDGKILPLIFLARNLRELGARRIGLAAPYLAYMRQDRRFQPGEAVSSRYFAELLSQYFDWLVTVDPHLHRIHSLGEIYTIPTSVIHAATAVARWLKAHLEKFVLVGPDEESRQWVEDVARRCGAPFMVLVKERKGDLDVAISVPDVDVWREFTPVLIDDIISSAQTMTTVVKALLSQGMSPPVCVGVHGIFAAQAYDQLRQAGAGQIVTCNTVPHVSNAIDLADDVVVEIKKILTT